MMSYRDYLIWTAALTAESLNSAITLALTMEHEEVSIPYLERKLDAVAALANFRHPDPERVEARPVDAS